MATVTPVYPFAQGYCQPSDVTARIKLGNYDPDQPGGITSAFIHDFITQAAAEIDMVLVRAGYNAPPAPLSGKTIGQQVYTMLLNINANSAAAMVESWRHSTDTASQDSQAKNLAAMAQRLLDKIADGSINLSLLPFNCAGPFEFQADPVSSMANPISDTDLVGNLAAPVFTIVSTQDERQNPLYTW